MIHFSRGFPSFRYGVSLKERVRLSVILAAENGILSRTNNTEIHRGRESLKLFREFLPVSREFRKGLKPSFFEINSKAQDLFEFEVKKLPGTLNRR